MKTPTPQKAPIPVTVPGQVACVIQALQEEAEEANQRAKDFRQDYDFDFEANESGFAFGLQHAVELLLAVYQKFPDTTLKGG